MNKPSCPVAIWADCLLIHETRGFSIFFRCIPEKQNMDTRDVANCNRIQHRVRIVHVCG
jgi:hypothetical protein